MVVAVSESKFYETICNNHNVVIANLVQMKKLTKDTKLRALIQDSLDYVRHCKKQGQRLENRLRSYHDTICDVWGYKRVRKGAPKSWDEEE